ncbi:hypothetical protein PIB30_010090 [Stylosanthes scabra]|uniref:Uncharacterized protein n=1 Tax=Stylosanthes scabra TaxID=79078 RepID=A0ABU6Y5S9_9FABA|nr:hypothetical protein [Stylosanthes scabra]
MTRQDIRWQVTPLHGHMITQGKVNTFMLCFVSFENGKYVGMKVLMKFEVLGLGLLLWQPLVSTNRGDGNEGVDEFETLGLGTLLQQTPLSKLGGGAVWAFGMKNFNSFGFGDF